MMPRMGLGVLTVGVLLAASPADAGTAMALLAVAGPVLGSLGARAHVTNTVAEGADEDLLVASIIQHAVAQGTRTINANANAVVKANAAVFADPTVPGNGSHFRSSDRNRRATDCWTRLNQQYVREGHSMGATGKCIAARLPPRSCPTCSCTVP